ncbi:DUF899 family protein [Microbacterium arabinogalactanolyticum]|uniref:DUF899 family protein n=1 Tax=Microbacterium arabinogalactanolyticum TaxID=69365 RepID=UPI002556C2CC|nr:DUF899 family protein [Microbacterium arabinogalactanolyticum]GLC86816.1 hypothetical protein MIAR_34010 [Microbacterium arabinogalactanolyticum]
MTALPPVVDEPTWREALAELRVREKAATRELDAIAAARRRLPAVKLPEYRLTAEDGSTVTLAEVFDGRSQLVTYHHMWSDGNRWQCPGCTGATASWTRPDLLSELDVRFVIVTNGPMDEVLAYKKRVGNQMTWFSSAGSTFGADVDAGPGEGFAYNVFLRDGDDVYRTWTTTGRGAEQFMLSFAIADVLPYGRQEEWQDVPEGWPQEETYRRWLSSKDVAAMYGDPDA